LSNSPSGKSGHNREEEDNMRFIWILAALAACNSTPSSNSSVDAVSAVPAEVLADTLVPASYDADGKLIRVERSEAEWKKQLSEKAYYVLREEGTEYAFSGAYWNNHQPGTYVCAGCGLPLFSSKTKFDSGTGWPSFWQPIEKGVVNEKRDDSHGMLRTEVECWRCGGHLGHVFDDGPRPTGLRYCINSVSLQFIPEGK
jgi:peptide-methionine (R)-S-oxide reductase